MATPTDVVLAVAMTLGGVAVLAAATAGALRSLQWAVTRRWQGERP
jgi:hypothetical protein